MNQKQFTPAEKIQYWANKLEEIKKARALLDYFEKQIRQRAKVAQAAFTQTAKV